MLIAAISVLSACGNSEIPPWLLDNGNPQDALSDTNRDVLNPVDTHSDTLTDGPRDTGPDSYQDTADTTADDGFLTDEKTTDDGDTSDISSDLAVDIVDAQNTDTAGDTGSDAKTDAVVDSGWECDRDDDCQEPQDLKICEKMTCLLHVCQRETLPDLQNCEDLSQCTINDKCSDGECLGTAISCDDSNICTSDYCSPSTGCAHSAKNNIGCDDNNSCTTVDKCNNKVCAGTPITCTNAPVATCNQDNTAITTYSSPGSCSGGVCSYPTQSTPCPAGCLNARCIVDPCANVQCLNPPNSCYLPTGTCSGGNCSYSFDNSATCTDNNLCTVDTCNQGVCNSVAITCKTPPPKKCDVDGRTLISYRPTGTCAGGECVYGFTSFTCQNGCIDGACDGDPCGGVDCTEAPDQCLKSPGTCVGGDCVWEADDQAVCTDSNACTEGDICQGKVCTAGTEVNCNDFDACTAEYCDMVSGCHYESSVALCDDNKVCTTDSCDPLAGCLNENNTVPCEDGSVCTTNDVCSNGTCLSGPDFDCSDNNICTNDLCDPFSGCDYENNTVQCRAASCTGKVFNPTAVCAAGSCQYPQAVNCDDQNVCTTDVCSETGGCSNTFNTIGCNDNNLCTTGDTCSFGNCGGTAVVCNDPPDDYCTGATVRRYELTGTCTDGTCGYEFTDYLCAFGCTAGKCDGNPCEGIVCNNPPSGCYVGTGTCADGTCTYGFANGTACSDNSECTVADKCLDGACVPGTALNCDDGKICTDQVCNPATGCVYTNNTSGCTDGTLCTDGDVCADGLCVPGPDLNCNDDKICTTDSCNATTGCVNTNVPNGDACDDNDPCTTTGTCQDGFCRTFAKNCADTTDCTTDYCDPLTGCVNAPNTNGCSDNNACTENDICAGGTCTSGTPKVCTDTNVCTDNSCNPASGCVVTNNTVKCVDQGCTALVFQAEGFCGGGTCNPPLSVNCNDGISCTVDSCDPVTGCHNVANAALCPDSGTVCASAVCDLEEGCGLAYNNVGCDDGQACTSSDFCMTGVCSGTPYTCPDLPCATGVCNGDLGCSWNISAGWCVIDETCYPDSAQNPNNSCQVCSSVDSTSEWTGIDAPCSDSDACTVGDTCFLGNCLSGSDDLCEDNNPCTSNDCAPASGCLNTPNTLPCNDNNACTINDTCGGGLCTGPARDCDDEAECTIDGCDPATGCTTDYREGTCDDGDACTIGDECLMGMCASAGVDTCNDYKPCTTDNCNPLTGCYHTNLPNLTVCDDNNPCTDNDKCWLGFCGGDGPDCNDENECTDDSCTLPDQICINPFNTNNCDDNNKCTTNDRCANGTCAGATPVVCNDNNVCTDDTCNPATGCVFTANTAPCNDANPCTENETCSNKVCGGGTAISCDDSNECTNDSCLTTSGCVHVNVSKACNDNNLCTYSDYCVNGNCGGQPIVCTNYLACTATVCDGTDQCALTINEGWCVIGGACVAADATPPGNACKSCDPTVSQESWTIDDTAICSDGNMCTSFDTCSNGTCGGTTYDCDDHLACTTDSCDGLGGCNNNPIAGWCAIEGACVADQATNSGNNCLICDHALNSHAWSFNNSVTCSDGDPCTINDTCGAGVCSGGGQKNCDDNNICTDNICDSTLPNGCKNQPVVAICADSVCNGLIYTAAAMCIGGMCPTPTPVNCDDSNICTTDECTATGCRHTANTLPCNDNTACTSNDTCNNSVCSGTPYTCPITGDCILSSACNGSGGCTDTPKTAGVACTSDGSPCTTDVCNATGTCVHNAVANGQPCNDNNLCTTGDTCLNGACSNGNDVVCQPLDTCHVAGTCNAGTGICSNPLKGNGESCNDGNACTSGDVCTDGNCAGPIFNSCPALDSCHNDGSCNPTTGACTYTTKGDGTACDDASLCTTRDVCSRGVCRGLDPIVCSPVDSCHLAGVCMPLTGTCTTPERQDGLSCEDGNLCTSGETCLSGSCQGGTARTCPAVNDCHEAGICNTSTGICTSPLKDDNTPCSDANSCTKLDHCVSGNCVSTPYTCFDGKSCTTDSCAGDGTCLFPVIADWCLISSTCRPAGQTNPSNSCLICNPLVANNSWSVNDGTACNDYLQSTKNDVCVGSVCTGTPYSCSDGLDCTEDVCDGIGGATHTISSGFCVIDGACHADNIVNPVNPCQRCLSTTNNQAWSAVNNGLSCNDSDTCTYSDKCQAGVCAGTTYSCDDSLECTNNSCRGNGECDVTLQPGFCVIWNACVATNDQNPLNTCQKCDPATAIAAWSPANESLACDDNNPQTIDDVCTNGFCIGTGPTCVDSLECTEDIVVPEGCSNPVMAGYCVIDEACYYTGTVDLVNRCRICDASVNQFAWSPNNGGSCSDDDECTTDDVCVNSTCTGTEITCSDGKACTADSCSQGLCVFQINAGSCLINGECLADGAVNPTNICEKCNSAVLTVNWSSNDGQACGDNDACTSNDVCVSKMCRGTSYSCDDGRACTADACNGTGGCNRTVNDGWCMIDGNCIADNTLNSFNSCQKCNHDTASDDWSGNTGATCNDNDSCTWPDQCNGEMCQGTAAPCNDGLTCTTDTCNGTGGCNVPVLKAGWCLIGNQCYANREVDPTNVCRMCIPEQATDLWSNRDGVQCSDLNDCTAWDTCSDGTCEGTAYGCNDGLACTTDVCDGLGGCDNSGLVAGSCLISGTCRSNGDVLATNSCMGCVAATDQHVWTPLTGTSCSDSNTCTTQDTCSAGTCSGQNHPCTDGIVCTDDVCDGTGGCGFPISENWCRIEGECLAAGTGHPTNLCMVCAPTISNTQWTSQESGAQEVCNGFDDNCDGIADPENSPGCVVYYLDADNDGTGIGTDYKCLCSASGNWRALNAGDCDDSEPASFPGNLEICDSLDNDCDGIVNNSGAIGCQTYYYDYDGDDFGQNGTQFCLCGADGFYTAAVGGDCNDSTTAVKPTATEVCNGIDDNCDGFTDPDNTTGCTQRYADQDLDGVGAGTGLCLCQTRGLYTSLLNTDCNDTSPGIRPGATELCNGIDENCDNTPDNGPMTSMCPLTPGYVAHGTQTCMLGECGLTCDTYRASPLRHDWYNMDGLTETGCECEADQYQKVSGDSCATATNLGSMPDDGSSVTITGNIPESGLVDWYTVTMTDPTWNAEPDNADLFNARIGLTQGSGGEFEMSITEGTCGGTSLCGSGVDFDWSVDFTAPNFGENPCAVLGDSCPDGNPTDYAECMRLEMDAAKCGSCPALPAPGFHQCTDNTRTFLVSVKRRANNPVSCNNYTLSIKNGTAVQNSNSAKVGLKGLDTPRRLPNTIQSNNTRIYNIFKDLHQAL